jgi:hypothetical protein
LFYCSAGAGMKLHPEELELAHAYGRSLGFEELSAQQVHAIRHRGRALYEWFKVHSGLHNLINCIVIGSILLADALSLLGLPRLILAGGRLHNAGWMVLASLATGCFHGGLMYSMSVFSLHEGAAHNLIFLGTGPIARAGQFLARNLCRLQQGEPEYYSACHMAHHAKFGTEHDSEFLNFIMPRRLWIALLPLASFANFSDFVIHRPPTYTRGRVISGVLSLLYHGGYAYLIYRSFGLVFAFFTIFIVSSHFAFYLDRLRQFTEHNLMPLENKSGARSLGIGFWGLLIGGGPWGQPCHLAHHLAPANPWYQQIVLHFYIKSLLSDRQQAQFLVVPFVGFPLLLWRVVHSANLFARERGAFEGTAGPAQSHRL